MGDDTHYNLISELQRLVEASKTDKQTKTSLEDRALFLATETGEVLKEVLRLRGLYGSEASEDAKKRLPTELCDLIWNACALASELGMDLSEPMNKMLDYNRNRTWDK